MLGNRLKAAAALACVLFLASCSQAPKASPKGEAEAGKSSAPGEPVPGVKNESGKAAMWTATFGSPRKQEARTYTYSVAPSAPDVVKGVSVGGALPWSGPTHDALIIDTADFSVDSDSAYQTALAQSAAWLKRHPDKEVSLALGNTSRFDGPVWYVLWGDQKSGHAVYVSAKSGSVVK